MEDISNKLAAIWEKDLLGRRNDAQYLGNYLSKRFQLKPDEPGFVLAIDGEWGFGKSFMIKRWQEELEFQNYPTVFFNAWENDYAGDPLMAFVSELDAGLQVFFDRIPFIIGHKNAFIEKVKNTWKPLLKALAFAASKKAIGFGAQEFREAINTEESEGVGGETEDDEFKELPEKVQHAIEKALSEHKTTKSAIAGFKKKLEILIEVLKGESSIQLPIFIFVDELDRCRPDYAIELLEGIKHLFGVRGVYFVVATNTVQLSESIRAIYGSGFDGPRYLKRFFDLQYTLPEPNNEEFAHSLFSRMEVIRTVNFVHGLNDLEGFSFSSNLAIANLESIVIVFSTHANAFGLGLRDQEQIIEMLEASFIQLKDQKIHIFFLIFLACTYHQDRAAFNSLAKTGIKDEAIFHKVRTAVQNGTIKYHVFSEGDRKNIDRSANLTDIASIYLSHQEILFEKVVGLGSNSNFPSILLREIQGEKEGRIFRPHFGTYFDVIRHAGGFNTRIKDK